MSPELEQLKEQLVAFIADTAGSLRTHMQEIGQRLERKMDHGFERLDARLGRHDGPSESTYYSA